MSTYQRRRRRGATRRPLFQLPSETDVRKVLTSNQDTDLHTINIQHHLPL
jgi:hypothetical protein